MRCWLEIYFQIFWPIWIFGIFIRNVGKSPFHRSTTLLFFGISTVIPGSKSLKIALLLLIGISWLAKYLLTYHFLKNEIRENPWLAWIPLGLLLMFPLILLGWEGDYWLLGKMTPNLWHNGSTIFVFPFCMLLFWEVRKWCIGSQPNFIPLISWTLLILLIKPSYLFGLIPGLMVMAIFFKYFQKISLSYWNLLGFGIGLFVGKQVADFFRNGSRQSILQFQCPGRRDTRSFSSLAKTLRKPALGSIG